MVAGACQWSGVAMKQAWTEASSSALRKIRSDRRFLSGGLLDRFGGSRGSVGVRIDHPAEVDVFAEAEGLM